MHAHLVGRCGSYSITLYLMERFAHQVLSSLDAAQVDTFAVLGTGNYHAVFHRMI